MDFNRTHLLGLTAAAAVLATGLPATAFASDANGALVGAGSTLVAPLEQNWASDFEAKNNISVTYGAVGSGAGITAITNRTVDFGASDAPLSPEQAAACNGCVQIPWGLTATGLAYNIPGVSALKLNGAVVAGIYEGKITNWNAPQIAAINKGTTLPNLKITPAFRSDGSGDTFAFTDFLSGVDKGWKASIGRGTAVSFPAGIGGKGNDGVTAVVSSTPGAIGYISASYIIAHKLKGAALENAAGKFVYPNLSNIEQAAKQVTKVPANNELHIVNPSKKSKQAYPLSTFTYVIVPKSSPKAALLKQFITYAITTGQGFGAVLDFAPIPSVVLKAANKTIASLG
jgi:phosphate transport system substrate-binding protein